MYAVHDEVETIHLYVVREAARPPYTALPLLAAFVCLLGIATLTLYSAQYPSYEYMQLTVPAVASPPKTFTAQVPIIPTGVKIYPATTAHGTLTITNGSIIAQVLPVGFTVGSIITDSAVYVPGGSATGYGYATVAANALIPGKGGDFATLAINQVIGSSVFIRNLTAFTGGNDSYSVKFATARDKVDALQRARSLLAAMVSGLHYPCNESLRSAAAFEVTWRCQFLTFHIPSYMHVSAVHLVGKNLIVSVWFIAPQKRIWAK